LTRKSSDKPVTNVTGFFTSAIYSVEFVIGQNMTAV
jgi:hypothetical protein